MVGTALIFDTETSGMFDWNKPAHEEGQPRMLSVAYALVDDLGNILHDHYTLIRPDGFEVDEDGEAFKVNQLTQERLMDEGRPVVEVLEEFDACTDIADFIAAFSIRFDQKVIRAEQRRAGRDDRYGYRPTFEIMYKARSYACGVNPANKLHSNPKKLFECYENIMGQPIVNAHDAKADLEATIDIYRHLLTAEMVEPKPQVGKS